MPGEDKDLCLRTEICSAQRGRWWQLGGQLPGTLPATSVSILLVLSSHTGLSDS